MQRRVTLLLLAFAAAILGGCASRDDAPTVLRTAEKTIGGTDLKTLRFAGAGTGTTYGQAFEPGNVWPRINIPSLTRWFDYENAALREDTVRTRAEPRGGGALPLMGAGEQRTSAWVRGDKAWNMVGPAPVAAPVALESRVADLWTSPHGFIKAALRHNATMTRDGGVAVIAFTMPGSLQARGWITSDGLLQRVDALVPHPVSGDTLLSTTYSGWRDWPGGIKFPTRIQQVFGGVEVMDLNVTQAEANPAFAADVPALVGAFAEKVDVQKVADGVWFLAGGSHNSVLVEFADHLMLVESPLYDGRAQAVFDEARRLAPGKPLRYVVNSHHHFDHAGGVRAAAATGATIVVSENARAWYERAFTNPNGIKPDALARSGIKPTFLGVSGRRVFSDGTRTAEVIQIDGSLHAQGFNMVWLPRERLLIEADAYTPGPPTTPAQPNALTVNLADNVERLGFDVDRILPLHGRVVPMGDLRAAAGRR